MQNKDALPQIQANSRSSTWLACALLCVFLLTPLQVEAEPLQVIAIELPGLLNSNPAEPAPYNRALTALISDSQLEIELTFLPLARAIHDYEAGKYDGLFPASSRQVQRPSIESKPFNRVKTLLFTRADSPLIRDLQALEGLIVGRVRGMPFSASVEQAPGSPYITDNEQQSITMLISGRIDAFFGAIPDTYLALEQMGLSDQVHTDPSIFYLDNNESLLLEARPEHAELITRFNRSIERLSANGRLHALLGIAHVK